MVWGSNPGGGEIFRTCPDRPWGPPNLLYNGYRVFPGSRKRPERDADPSPLLVPRSKKQSSAVPLLSLRVFVACKKGETCENMFRLAMSHLQVIWTYCNMAISSNGLKMTHWESKRVAIWNLSLYVFAMDWHFLSFTFSIMIRNKMEYSRLNDNISLSTLATCLVCQRGSSVQNVTWNALNERFTKMAPIGDRAVSRPHKHFVIK
jgi:hypothetical protein